VLAKEGKLSEAESLHREALAIRRKVFGEEHVEVASSLDNLALTLRAAGRLEEAETLERQALAMRRKLLGGEENLAVAGSFNNLGMILQDREQLAEAESAFRDSLRLESKILGADHPSIGIIRQHLIDVLKREHKVGEADALANELHGKTGVVVRRE
jgi:tetratricopeptide (TPR) repeat protein